MYSLYHVPIICRPNASLGTYPLVSILLPTTLKHSKVIHLTFFERKIVFHFVDSKLWFFNSKHFSLFFTNKICTRNFVNTKKWIYFWLEWNLSPPIYWLDIDLNAFCHPLITDFFFCASNRASLIWFYLV